MIALTIPEEPERGAVRSWRKLVRGVKEGAADAYGIDGQWLDAGRAYELPEQALVIACDVFAECRTIAVYQVRESGFEEIKAWELKSRLGKRATDWVGRRLAGGAASHRAVAIEDAPNRWAGRCCNCRQPVAAGEGLAWRDRDTDASLVSHRKGECPPPPPPPQRVEPNQYGGPCCRCGGWVASGEGAAILTPEAVKGRYAAVHGSDCPADPGPGPANQRKGWCERCGRPLKPGMGCWQEGTPGSGGKVLACHPACPPGEPEPSWVVRVHDGPVEAGDVIRARIEAGKAPWPVPEDAPGYRRLPGEEGLVQVIAVVLDVARGQHGGMRARVRAASEEEAAPLAAEDVLAALSVSAHPDGYRAQWTAEQYRDRKPWVAEVTGYDHKYGLERQFLRSRVDWKSGSASGHRTDHCWTLQLNKVYEAWWPDGYRREKRAFLRATPAGDVKEITREEAEAWLGLPQPHPAR